MGKNYTKLDDILDRISETGKAVLFGGALLLTPLVMTLTPAFMKYGSLRENISKKRNPVGKGCNRYIRRGTNKDMFGNETDKVIPFNDKDYLFVATKGVVQHIWPSDGPFGPVGGEHILKQITKYRLLGEIKREGKIYVSNQSFCYPIISGMKRYYDYAPFNNLSEEERKKMEFHENFENKFLLQTRGQEIELDGLLGIKN